MTNEQQKARELATLLNAFADGKQLQRFYKPLNEWGELLNQTLESIIQLFTDGEILRIKSETKLIALNQQDLIDRELSGKTMRVRKADSDFDSVLITLISQIGIAVYDCQQIITYEELKENFYWLDGTPCYKEVECE